MTRDVAMGLGWRVHSSWAVVVAVGGSADAPEIVHRERVDLIDDHAAVREPFHAAAALVGGRIGPDAEPFLGEARTLIEAVEDAAATAAAATLRGFTSSLGPIAAVGVVGGDRPVPTKLAPILVSHARLHASERDLFARAVVRGATDAGLPVTTIPASGRLIDDASAIVGVALATSLTSLGKAIGPPWQKDHREAAAAALVALTATA